MARDSSSFAGSSLDIGRVQDFVNGMQDSKDSHTFERILIGVVGGALAGNAWSVYRRYQRGNK